MAKKLDWSKARADKLKSELISSQTQTSNANSDKYYKYKSDIETQIQLLKQGIWPTGKHQGHNRRSTGRLFNLGRSKTKVQTHETCCK